jgi:NAD kinase
VITVPLITHLWAVFAVKANHAVRELEGDPGIVVGLGSGRMAQPPPPRTDHADGVGSAPPRCGRPYETFAQIDLIVCLGGDGTLMFVASQFQKMTTPVPPMIAYSMGSLGFLTPFAHESHEAACTMCCTAIRR